MSETFDDTTRFQADEDLSWRDVNEELVVLNLASGQYTTFNGVGRAMWLALAEQKSVAETVQQIVSAYDAECEAVASDVRRFAAELVSTGLLTREPV